MDLSAGTRLGPYEILEPLGAGGMGQVYKARDTRLGRTVAVKVLAGHLALDPVFRKRFEREARSISSLNHPHICVLHDVGRQDDRDFLVMEFLEGETLAERLEKGALPTEQVVKIGMQIVIEDYVHNEKLKLASVMANNFFCIAVALASIYAILKLSSGV